MPYPESIINEKKIKTARYIVSDIFTKFIWADK